MYRRQTANRVTFPLKGETRVSGLAAGEVAVGVVVFGGLGAYWLAGIRGAAQHERAVLKEHAHATRAHYAAVEAAEDDPSFSPEAIEKSVAEIVSLAGELWRSGAPGALAGRPDAGLIRTWARSWQSRLGDDLEAVGQPSVDLLSVVNRDDETEDRVVVRVRQHLHCKHSGVGSLKVHHAHTDERWTFGRSGGRWALLSVGGDPLAGPLLTAPLIATPSSDTERLQEESLAELATAQEVGDGVALSDLVGAEEPPAFALLDISVVDSRFEGPLIAAEIAHILEVWEGAVTGSEAPLEELASVQARTALLRPSPGARLVVRDVVLKSWEATRLDLSRDPPGIEVALDVEAVRYAVRADGSPVAGNTTEPRRMALRWVLELTDSKTIPWRLATSNNPAEAIPGWP
jgi:hypothetical protein